VKEPVYKTPNGKFEVESILKEKYGNDFENLISNNTFVLDSEEPLKKKEQAQLPMEANVSGTTESPSGSTSLGSPKPFDKNALLSKGLKQASISTPLENAPVRQQKVLTNADRLDVSGNYKKLNERLSSVDDKLINNNEEYVVPELNYKFGDLGFKFEESGATGDTFIFETEPQDALPDVFFENNESYAIDEEGNHLGAIGDQDQNITLGQIGIIHTGFFNCFSFGNGAESYTIRDSIIGRPFNLGQRVTGVAVQDYKEAHRFADITYSGIYNTESNINKLNEFNLGLLNYKYLESSFGPIYRLDGRQTDVLTLQEDKISYVLAGKNLLSDAAGGGALTSVPEVLGTQIARTEKYGISFNPESYVQWGFDRFFTDVKRGVVIQLRGTAASNEELKVVSEMNMRTWFRDNFNEYFNTQKLGGFDPYMNEYVLCSNDQELPLNPQCVQCGVTQTLTLASSAGLNTYVSGNI